MARPREWMSSAPSRLHVPVRRLPPMALARDDLDMHVHCWTDWPQVIALLIGLVPCLAETCVIVYFHRK